jgi:hypothetical protein
VPLVPAMWRQTFALLEHSTRGKPMLRLTIFNGLRAPVLTDHFNHIALFSNARFSFEWRLLTRGRWRPSIVQGGGKWRLSLQ